MNTMTNLRAAFTAPQTSIATATEFHSILNHRTEQLQPNYANSAIGLMLAALAEERVSVVYQPQFNIQTLEVTGAEALCRLRDRQGEIISPGSFISEVEQSNAIHALTSKVARTAYAQLSHWQHLKKGMHMAINVCERDLAAPDFVTNFLSTIDAYGLAYNHVELEVVERAPILAGSIAERNLHELAFVGIQIAIDDFGCGHSTAEAIERIPATKLKLDRSLVNRLAANLNLSARTSLVIDRAHSLGMSVIAEGIENELEFETARRLGCDIAQGYLLSKPQAAENVTRLIQPAILH